jgi:hypothetical protein
MKIKNFLLLLCVVTNVHAADFLTGAIIDNNDGTFEINSPKGVFKLETSDLIKKSLPSLANPTYVKQSNGQPYSYEFKGELDGNTFILEQTPTNIPGAESLTGVLEYNAEEDRYYIGEQEVTFGYTKTLNNYSFDEVSKKSFIGKELIVEGRMDNGLFIMQALTPTGLFSAAPAKKSIYDKHLNWNSSKFMGKYVYQNGISKSQNSFRKTIYNKRGYTTKPGESVFLVTLSGRQGDSFGSVNGHFVAGLGEVKKDLTLRAEVSNAYVTNGKDILSGNTSLTNYFSNLVQGQNNYRPTYTFIAYGIDKKKLKKFRDFLEPSHIEFRTKKLDITLEFNCTTETAKGLDLAGIKGNHRRTLINRVMDFNNLAIPLRVAAGLGETADNLTYALATDKEDYMPRPAFHSYVDSLMSRSTIRELGIKRMDYIFYSQIPSQRPIGGAPSQITYSPLVKYDSLRFKQQYDKYENEETKTEDVTHAELLELLKELDNVQ